MNDSTWPSRFTLLRQRPTDDPDEYEDLGNIEYPSFREILRNIEWRREANQAKWASRALPSLAVRNRLNDSVMLVNAEIAESVVDLRSMPEGIPKGDPYEPWFFLGLSNLPDIRGVTALNARGGDEQPGFMTFALEPVEESFRWFFEDDYVSLYERFRWI